MSETIDLSILLSFFIEVLVMIPSLLRSVISLMLSCSSTCERGLIFFDFYFALKCFSLTYSRNSPICYGVGSSPFW
jgi:hypothetical protein